MAEVSLTIAARDGYPLAATLFRPPVRASQVVLLTGAMGVPRTFTRVILVELARSQISVRISASESILDALLEAGVWAPYECKRGECGMCVTPVLEGEPDHRDLCLTESDRERFMCTCVSRAQSDKLVLDL